MGRGTFTLLSKTQIIAKNKRRFQIGSPAVSQGILHFSARIFATPGVSLGLGGPLWGAVWVPQGSEATVRLAGAWSANKRRTLPQRRGRLDQPSAIRRVTSL